MLALFAHLTQGAHISGTGLARPLRTVAPRMQDAATWPPPLDAVHVFEVDYGGSENAKIALTEAPAEKRAVLALWRFMYAHEAGGGEELLARTDAELRAELSLAADATVFGAYGNGVDGEEHGLALVRFQRDDEDEKLMIIDTVVSSPKLPPYIRPTLHDAVVQSLRAIGDANGMTVRLWSDYDV